MNIPARCGFLFVLFAFLGTAASQEVAPKRESIQLRMGMNENGPEWVTQDLQQIRGLEERRQKQLESVGKFDVFHSFQFIDQQRESGITFKNNVLPDAGKEYKAVHYDHAVGLVVSDVDGDGKYDLYFISQVGGNQLWRNLGQGRFENFTEQAGIAMADSVNVSAAFADIDNDGDPDLYVSTVRHGNRLFVNDGKGHFTDVTAAAGLSYTGHSSGMLFFDYDRDGLLDLFLTNVGTYTTDVQAPVGSEDGPSYWVGMDGAFLGHLYPERAEASILYRNMGDIRFEDVSNQVGLVDKRWSGDAIPIDANNDGWTDLYVLNMQGHDEYYENDKGQRFIARGAEVFPRTPYGTMGAKAFDYNNDGYIDLYLTDMHSDMNYITRVEDEAKKSVMETPGDPRSISGNAFFRGDGSGGFLEVSDEIGAENFWPWGFSVGDLNADGFEDVFIASSMNHPFRYGINNVLLNNRGKEFLASEFILGIEPRRDGIHAVPWFTIDCGVDDHYGAIPDDIITPLCNTTDQIEIWSARGTKSSVIIDIDDDGDLDIVTMEFGAEPMVLISNLSEKKEINYLKIKLVGTQSNRDGLGAKVTVKTSEGTYVKVHDGVSGYLSHSVFPLYFGLGGADSIDRIEVAWPSGQNQVITEDIQTNTLLEIVEN